MEGDRHATLTIGRDYCRGCERPSTQRFAGWATSDGHENSSRPRAFYRTCDVCRTMRLVLGNVNDAEGLCRKVLKKWLEKSATSARVGAVERPFGDGALDADDGLSFLSAEIWRLYCRWVPAQSKGSFLAYASELLPKRLATWSYNASGEANERMKVDRQRGGKVRPAGRVYPKAHAASVSLSLDAATFGDEHADEGGTQRRASGDTVAVVSGGGAHLRPGAFDPGDAETCSSDLLRALTAGSGGEAGNQRGPRHADAERAARTSRPG